MLDRSASICERYILKPALIYTAVLVLFVMNGCATSAGGVFFRPEGTTTELYSTNPERLKITVYPEVVSYGQHKGAILFVHGGGWETGGSDLPLYSDWEPYINRAGLRAFSIEHRLAPEYHGRALIEDVLSAIGYINRNAKRFNIPDSTIHLVGFSSGGHLALSAALQLDASSKRSPVRSVSAFYAPTNPAGRYFTAQGKLKKYLHNYLPETDRMDRLIHSIEEIEHDIQKKDPMGAQLIKDNHFSMNDISVSMASIESNGALLLKLQGQLSSAVADRSALISLQEKLAKKYSEANEILDKWKDISPIFLLKNGRTSIFLIHGKDDELVPVEDSRAFIERARNTGRRNVDFLEVNNAGHNFVISRSQWASDIRQKTIQFMSP